VELSLFNSRLSFSILRFILDLSNTVDAVKSPATSLCCVFSKNELAVATTSSGFSVNYGVLLSYELKFLVDC